MIGRSNVAPFAANFVPRSSMGWKESICLASASFPNAHVGEGTHGLILARVVVQESAHGPEPRLERGQRFGHHALEFWKLRRLAAQDRNTNDRHGERSSKGERFLQLCDGAARVQGPLA